jgi:aspartyl-tRNA(Asn)/glutamyl-tRNA(Gln) amidotransferase subunit A
MAVALSDIIHLLPYFLGRDPSDASTIDAKCLGPIPERPGIKLIHLKGAGLERSDEISFAIEDALSRSGAEISVAALPNLRRYFASWDAILHCEASTYHADLLARHPAGFTPVTRAHLEAGFQLSAVELLEAQKSRGHLLKTILKVLPSWDALVSPTLPVCVPRHGEKWQEFGGRRVTTQDSMTWFCWIGNLAGLPCLTIPIGKSNDGLPVGMMLMGKPGKDEDLLALGKIIDRNINERE